MATEKHLSFHTCVTTVYKSVQRNHETERCNHFSLKPIGPVGALAISKCPSRSLCQVLDGLPFYFFPWRFQVLRLSDVCRLASSKCDHRVRRPLCSEVVWFSPITTVSVQVEEVRQATPVEGWEEKEVTKAF